MIDARATDSGIWMPLIKYSESSEITAAATVAINSDIKNAINRQGSYG